MQSRIQQIIPPGLVTAVLALLISILIAPGPAGATEYHVYSGQNLQSGINLLYAGDTLWVHAGTYTTSSYEFIRNGTAGAPITVARWADDTVYLNTTSNGFYVTRNYVVIDGFIITPSSSKNCVRVDSNYVTIRNCTLRNSALAYKSNLSAQNHHHLIENCTMYNFTDIAIFPDELDSIIIRNNTIYDGNSVLMDPGGVSNMVIEGNFAYNTGKWLGELKIRWGNNEPQSGPNCRGAIVRRNVFVNGNRYVVLLASAKGAAVYNNTLCNDYISADGIIFMQQDGGDAGSNNNNDNTIRNNIFYHSGAFGGLCVFMQSSMSEDYAEQDFDYNLYYRPYDGQYVGHGNTFYNQSQINGWYGGMYDVHSMAGVDPQMVNPTTSAGRDGYRLTGASPAIDAGGPLTTTIGAGSGTVIAVGNAKYFCDGLDMIDGDLIRIGSNPPVRVTGRDINTNVLLIDTSISWSSGDWVNLDYNGAGPDIGAFETEALATVEGRYVFYNNSYWDGDDPAANASDDAAIAPDKTALLPGGTAAFANYTSYARGINGVMVDIDGLPGAPTASDFTFKVGNDSAPAGWATAPAPSSITVRAGAGAGGSDRITIIWADNAIQKQWLQVTVLATANTGLSTADTFYFGNAIGDATGDGDVTPSDEIMVRNNPHTLGSNPAAIDDVCDFNRDRKVGPTDQIISRNNGTSGPTALQLITVP